MSAPTTRRLSALVVNCVYCTRCTLRTAPARRRQWQRTVGSCSRRWYADDTRPAPRAGSPKGSGHKNAPVTKQDDVIEAAQGVVAESQQKSPQATADISISVSTGDESKNTDWMVHSNPLSGDIEAELPHQSTAQTQNTVPVEDSTVQAAKADEAQLRANLEAQATTDKSDASSIPAGLQVAAEAEALEVVKDAADDAIPEGAVLVSEEEEEGLEDILGTIDTSAQAPDPVSMENKPDAIPEGVLDAVKKRLSEGGFWNYAAEGAGDAEYLKNNVTSLGHDELEQQREYREYARLAAWELPLLSKLAKPFTPPTKEQPLRFRYTSYLGEEHPAAAKVVLEFSPSDLPSLTKVQRDKMIKLLGPRYNPSTDTAKMSCENYETQAQNKRYLLDRVGDLLKEVKEGKDTFEDVPFDFRHHKPKKWHEFPKEWIVTEERLQELLARRRTVQELEKQREELGALVDGKRAIEKTLEEPTKEPERVIVNRVTGKPVLAGRRARF